MSVRKRKWKTAKGVECDAWIVDYVDQAGDRHIQTFERKKEADDYWATVKVDVRHGTHVAPSKSPTVAEAAERWLKDATSRGLERSTLEHYKQHANLHIVPLIGNTKLAGLTHDRVSDFRDKLLAKLSRTLARKVLINFKSLLKVSRHSHVAVGVSIPKSRKERRKIEAGRDFPTTTEVARLLVAAKDNTKARALLLILAFTGLRASEFRGLRWRDVDLKACELHVRQRADQFGAIGAPKSESSVRTIPLDPEVMVPALREWKLQCPHGELVFSTRTGKPQDYNDVRIRVIDPVMRAAGLVDKDGVPKYAPHALRHFFASWCINPKARGGRELPPKQVQYLLGHSTISMTFDTYGHLFPSEGNRDELTAAVRQLLA